MMLLLSSFCSESDAEMTTCTWNMSFSEYCQLWLGLEHIDIMILKFEIGGTTLCSQQVGCCSLANSRII